MRIYFAGSVAGGREDSALYFAIINILKKYGTVLTEHIGDVHMSDQGETLEAENIFDRDMDWVMSADLIVAEVTTPSLGVGYELGRAEALGKRIICFFRSNSGRRLSPMISGNQKLQVENYATLEDIDNTLKNIDI